MNLTDLIMAGKELAKHGLVPGASGNLSMRKGRKIVITKTRAFLGSLTESDFVEVGIDEYDPIASGDLKIHQAIYRDSEVRYVFHGHGTFITVLSFLNERIVPVDVEGKVLNPDVAVVEGEYGDEKLGMKISSEIRENSIVVVRAHGVYAGGNSWRDLAIRLISLEQSCRILYYHLLIRGDASTDYVH